MEIKDNEIWVIKHKAEIEKAFNQNIESERLSLFCSYDTLEDMRKEFYDLADESKPYVKRILNKWVIQLA